MSCVGGRRKLGHQESIGHSGFFARGNLQRQRREGWLPEALLASANPSLELASVRRPQRQCGVGCAVVTQWGHQNSVETSRMAYHQSTRRITSIGNVLSVRQDRGLSGKLPSNQHIGNVIQ